MRVRTVGLAVVVALVGGLSLAVIRHANADVPYQPRPVLTVTGASDWYSPCPPCYPTGQIGMATHQSVSMRWTDTRTDETAYRLYRIYPNGGGSTTLVREFERHAGTGTVHTLNYGPVPLGISLCFYVRALTQVPNNNDSASVCGAYGRPGVPGTPQVAWSDADSIDVEFRRSLSYEAGYKVYTRRSNETQWTVTIPRPSDGGAPASGNKRLRITGLQPSTRYCFKVSGYHALFESAQTAEVCGSTVSSPTAGWTGYNDSYFIVKPWNLDVDDRFSTSVGVYRTWVYSTDAPHHPDSPTNPRTEMAWDTTYTSGQRMWEADVYIMPGTDGSNIFQIFRAEHPADDPVATDIRLRVYNVNGGELRPAKNGNGAVVASGLYGRWFNLKVAHNVATRQITIYVDDRRTLQILDYDNFPDPPSGSQKRRFKNGVYGSNEGRAETHFRNVEFWRR